ncbi:hypothetical protein Pyrfu_0589 [Pyrolobus fumarii 1A]|uniref:Uncharacterized protein n=1 Tax=Pyrolobus fumarii (strain DSM 11204 / 1A) TaxID=694429 RepID=G0EH09_PYRF1|nr:hypothetical protein Pyrfu_0589 [Pyrolobus fumarii 1A]
MRILLGTCKSTREYEGEAHASNGYFEHHRTLPDWRIVVRFLQRFSEKYTLVVCLKGLGSSQLLL